MSHWNEQKQIGDAAEQSLASLLQETGIHTARAPAGYFPYFDLRLSATVEVKFDAESTRTGNLFYELAHNGKPSGWALSMANTVALYESGGFLLIARSTLNRIAEGYPTREFRIIDGTKLAKLIPMSRIRMFAVLIQEIMPIPY